MTELNPRHANLSSVLSEMENDAHKVGHWADVLMAVGTATHLIPPAAVYAIGEALQELGASLEEQYEHAFRLSRHPVR